jgi:hypothetical protein
MILIALGALLCLVAQALGALIVLGLASLLPAEAAERESERRQRPAIEAYLAERFRRSGSG